MEIAPPQPQSHWQVLLSAGISPIMTVGDPGAHGAAVTGTHGMGLRTPMAAAVAAATVWFYGDIHMPNGAISTMGT